MQVSHGIFGPSSCKARKLTRSGIRPSVKLYGGESSWYRDLLVSEASSWRSLLHSYGYQLSMVPRSVFTTLRSRHGAGRGFETNIALYMCYWSRSRLAALEFTASPTILANRIDPEHGRTRYSNLIPIIAVKTNGSRRENHRPQRHFQYCPRKPVQYQYRHHLRIST